MCELCDMGYIDTEYSNEPFKRKEMKHDQSKEELLEAYEKISSTFDDFTQLMRKRVPYQDWPEHCKIAGVSENLLGRADEPAKKNHAQRNKDVWDVLREHGINPLESFPSAVIKRLEDIGRAQQKLKSILDDDIFDNLSKHDPYWDSEHEPEADRFHDVRMKLNCMRDNLWDLWAILRNEEE